MPQTIGQIRDLLLPGIHIFAGKIKKNLDVLIDPTTDSIYILVENHGKHLLFSRKDIEDNTYKIDFMPRMTKIIESFDNKVS